MHIELTDDGTLDTVLRCTECGKEFRYNFSNDAEPDETELTSEEAYDAFVSWAAEDAASEHVCGEDV